MAALMTECECEPVRSSTLCDFPRKQAECGYAHPDYTASLAEFGKPIRLARCGGWLLSRSIQNSELRDAIGPYPLFVCREWSGLRADLDELAGRFLTLAMVADPFGGFGAYDLETCFDRVSHFKDRYIVDLRTPVDLIGSRHHRYYARKALRSISVECCDSPAEFADDWVELYDVLKIRHRLCGLKAFTPGSLRAQLSVPGAAVFRASIAGESVGMHVWYTNGEVAYSHLTASSAAGYRMGAAYALHAYAIRWFSRRARWLDLGSGPGAANRESDGLSWFKSGWATGIRPTYFCARVFDSHAYRELVRSRGCTGGSYFPAYRAGELA